MLSLSKEEKKSYHKQKTCHICKNKFSNYDYEIDVTVIRERT